MKGKRKLLCLIDQPSTYSYGVEVDPNRVNDAPSSSPVNGQQSRSTWDEDTTTDYQQQSTPAVSDFEAYARQGQGGMAPSGRHDSSSEEEDAADASKFPMIQVGVISVLRDVTLLSCRSIWAHMVIRSNSAV